MKLSEDLAQALNMMEEIEQLRKRLPGIDCGSCGSPTCRAFAEDVVKGKVHESECLFILKDQVKKAAKALSHLGAEDDSE